MEERLPLSLQSAAQLRAQAAVYRRMAATAHTAAVLHGLMKIADRYDQLAETREKDAREAARPVDG